MDKRILAGAAVLLLIGGFAVFQLSGSSSQPTVSAKTPNTGTQTAKSSPTGTASPALTDDKKHAPAKGSWLSPQSYELTMNSDESVAVNLRGGRSGVYPFAEPGEAPPVVRVVRGRVQTSSGQPAARAVVLASDEFHQSFDSFTAKGGATTDDAGQFEIQLRHEAITHLMAMHPLGWSEPTAVAAGTADLIINLKLEKPGRLRGQVTLAKDGVEAELRLVHQGRTLILQTATSLDGNYKMEVVPPGTYKVTAKLAQNIGGGVSRAEKRTIVVKSGEEHQLNVELPTGGLLVVEAEITGPEEFGVHYTLIPGHHDPARPKENVKGGFGLVNQFEDAVGQLYGGSDKRSVSQFHDLDYGPYTVCVQVIQFSPSRVAGFRCEQASVENDEPVVVQMKVEAEPAPVP